MNAPYNINEMVEELGVRQIPQQLIGTNIYVSIFLELSSIIIKKVGEIPTMSQQPIYLYCYYSVYSIIKSDNIR